MLQNANVTSGKQESFLDHHLMLPVFFPTKFTTEHDLLEIQVLLNSSSQTLGSVKREHSFSASKHTVKFYSFATISTAKRAL